MLALTPSRHLRPDVRGLCLLQEDAAVTRPAEPVEGARKEGKAKTQKTKQPPASTPASSEHRQVEHLVLGSLPVLLSVPVCRFWPHSFQSSSFIQSFGDTLLGARDTAVKDTWLLPSWLTFSVGKGGKHSQAWGVAKRRAG